MKHSVLEIFVMTLIFVCSCKNIDKGNETDLFTKLYNTENLTTQTFSIDNNIDNLITGESGTILRINKNIFVDKNGKPIKGLIEIKLIEALKPIDMVLGNLTTTTFDNQLLQTGGMLYINATSNNETADGLDIRRDVCF
jgi:hypothetical protein